MSPKYQRGKPSVVKWVSFRLIWVVVGVVGVLCIYLSWLSTVVLQNQGGGGEKAVVDTPFLPFSKDVSMGVELVCSFQRQPCYSIARTW